MLEIKNIVHVVQSLLRKETCAASFAWVRVCSLRKEDIRSYVHGFRCFSLCPPVIYTFQFGALVHGTVMERIKCMLRVAARCLCLIRCCLAA
jgi:hypothetical protein